MSRDLSFLKRDILYFNSQDPNKEDSEADINSLETASSDSEPGLKRYFTLKSDFINEEILKSAHSFTSNEIEIYFPYIPYIPQKILMQRVLDSIDQKKNALLESPTGTGKTVSLLCASLAWLYSKKKSNPEKKTKIFYATRTHSQIKQIVKELRKTAYNPVTCILAAREHYCLKFKDREENDHISLRTKCSEATKTGTCEYVQKLHELGDDFIKESKRTIRDIEDAVDFGKSCNICPYYFQKNLLERAELVILPYSYLLDHRISDDMFNEETRVTLENQIIIFDEAHNIEKAAEDGMSFNFSLKDVNDCYQDLNLIELSRSGLTADNIKWIRQNLKFVQAGILELQKKIEKQHQKNNETGLLAQGKDINTIFSAYYYDRGGYETAIRLLTLASDSISAIAQNRGSLEALRDFLQLLQDVKLNMSSYWLIMTPSQTNTNLTFQCVNPALAFNDLRRKNPRCIILTSGTLRPLEAVRRELETPFEIELVNNHVIDAKTQSYSAIIKQGLNGTKLSFDHHNRNDWGMLRDMGNLLIEICRKIPHGVLVSFASYKLMDTCLNCWTKDQGGRINTEINKLKELYVEPRDTIIAKKVVEDYRRVAPVKGAMLFGVCKGKIFEGMDFPDSYARAVVVVGMPNPNHNEPVVASKLQFLKNRSNNNRNSLTGDQWHDKEVHRGVCQAVGRVIRHANDYGVVLLCDSRFDNQKWKEALPLWVRTNLEVVDNFRQVQNKITNLLNQNAAKQAAALLQKGVTVPTKKPLENTESEETNVESRKVKVEGNQKTESYKQATVPTFPDMDDL